MPDWKSEAKNTETTDWRAIAAAVEPAIPEDAQIAAAAKLEVPQATLREYFARIPPEQLLWTGPTNDSDWDAGATTQPESGQAE